jgi:hypothetical protein
VCSLCNQETREMTQVCFRPVNLWESVNDRRARVMVSREEKVPRRRKQYTCFLNLLPHSLLKYNNTCLRTRIVHTRVEKYWRAWQSRWWVERCAVVADRRALRLNCHCSWRWPTLITKRPSPLGNYRLLLAFHCRLPLLKDRSSVRPKKFLQ